MLFQRKDPSTKKSQKQKATRMPENLLMDALYEGFRKYRFWSMKALRDQLKQPEAYLRSTLEKIAVLNKSGFAANTWVLKDMAGKDNDQMMVDDGIAPEGNHLLAPEPDGSVASSSDDEDMDDDDEDIKFEDV